MESPQYKIVYCAPAIYSAGGVERIVTYKASYLAEHYGYDVTIIITEGEGRTSFFPLSEKVQVVNFELGFEELWKVSFLQKVWLYLKKQHLYQKRLRAELFRIRPNFTISMLRREINFLTDIKDGSLKIGELHVNRENYRNFEDNETNVLKRIFAKLWMRSLVRKLKRLDQLVVLTEKSKSAWPELTNVSVIPDPLPLQNLKLADVCSRRVITIGRYAYQKGYDLLLKAWAEVEKCYPDWNLEIFGMGDQTSYKKLMAALNINSQRCILHGPVNDVREEYRKSSIFVLSSRFEGFGLVLIEAMASGLPVVTFNCKSGPDEIVTHGKDGLLVPSGQVHALAESLKSLMGDEERRRLMSNNAVVSAKRYEMSRIACMWNDLFDGLLRKSPADV